MGARETERGSVRTRIALQVSVTPRPASLYTAKPYSPAAAPIRSSTPGTIDFSEELRKFQLENNVVVTSERPGAAGAKSSEPIYSTELVFDPASGQYNTVVYQSLPKPQPQDISTPVQYAPAPGHSSAPQTQFYYVSPQDAGDQRAALAAGQIDAFLRGHNLSF
ncbi:ABC transporter C family member 9 [Frankliniella fusca]|uniref:ABC transporter C family member 9 n=1 Tax=Frankliniella fusca TaxID=407009 RepID=A0AAE1H8K1_9NEOP|nr:ABC transporter C family member 9 [Frankliniella fusca]